MDDEASDEAEKWIEQYPLFKARMRRIFGPANKESLTESVIQRLRQTKSAANYTTTFQHYIAKTKQNDKAQILIFKRGLKDNIQDELIRYRGIINDLEDLIKVLIELNNKLYQRSIEKLERNRGRFTGRATWGQNRQGRRNLQGQDQ